jgi:Spy/CpxP family protein refolding chaperone
MRRLVFYMLVCFFVLSGVSMARDRGYSRDGIEDLPRGKWWRMPEVASELKISSDEQAKLDDLYYKHRNQMIDHKSELKKGQIALEWFIEKEKLDESACKDQFQKVLEARNKLSTERYNFLIEVRKLLGYERFLQLKPKSYELRKEKSQKDKGRREPKR